MEKDNKPIIIPSLVILVIVLPVICFLIMKNSGKYDKEEQSTFSDDNGDFNIESLFEASKETLFYAGKLKIGGYAECITTYDKGFDNKCADITYTRDYIDNDNYLGHTTVLLRNRTNVIAALGDLWQSDYEYYLGKKEGAAFEKFIVGDRKDDLNISSPDIESILFPDISNLETSFRIDKMNDYDGTGTDAYVVTLKGDLSQLGDAARSLVGEMQSPYSADYYFNTETHVIERVYIYSRPTSAYKRNDENAPLFTLELYVEKYGEREGEETIDYPDYYFEDRAFNYVLSNQVSLELNGGIMASGNTFAPELIGDYWSQNVSDMWHEITDNGRARLTLNSLYEKACAVGGMYGYPKIKVSFGKINDPEYLHSMLIRFDFQSDEHGTGTILIPQTIKHNKLSGNVALASLGNDEIDVMGKYFTLARDNSESNSERVIGAFYESISFNYIAHEMFENPISEFGRLNGDIERFPYDYRSKLLGATSADNYRNDVRISYHRFYDSVYTGYRKPTEELFIVKASDEKSSNTKEALSETVKCLNVFGIRGDYESELKSEYESRRIDIGLEQDKTEWIEIELN